MTSSPELTLDSLEASLREALVKALGPQAADIAPTQQSENAEALRTIGKEGRPRLRRLFEDAAEQGGTAADAPTFARAVARACEDLFVAVASMQAKVAGVAGRSGVSAMAMKEALLRIPKVHHAIVAAFDLVKRLTDLSPAK